MPRPTRPKNDILQGTLALLVLKTLAAQGPLHGYAITSHIQRVSAELLRVEEGSLYPALHRMEQDGWVRSEWGTTEKNRQARFYSLRPRASDSSRASRRAGRDSRKACDGCCGMLDLCMPDPDMPTRASTR